MKRMSSEYSDLLYILADVRRNVADSRLIWCTTADGFETTVSSRRGLILGGAWSPHFLRDREAAWWDVPWTMNLRAPTIVTIEKAVMPLSEWLPLMEAIAQAGTSLLLVTRDVSTELLRTFIANALKETLSCCVVQIAEDLAGWGVPVISTPWGVLGTPPKKANGLPQAAEAWIRRTATVLFPAPASEWLPAQDITIISVGGRNHDNQHDRLRFLVEEIQNS
jgi:hypothetical protein